MEATVQQTREGYDAAKAAIAAGTAEARALWVLLTEEDEREGYWLKPMPWEGSGEYQAVHYNDGRAGFVKIPFGEQALRTPQWGKR